jgi:hypothetical protein
MSEQTYATAKDLSEAGAMVERLESYVRGSELYVQLGGLGALFGGGSLPSMTVGALLLRLRRLEHFADRMSAEQRGTLNDLRGRHAHIRDEWLYQYDQKLTREAHSRLDAMRRFFEECAESPRQCASNYLPEALRRTIVQELLTVIDERGIEDEKLPGKVREIDSRLRRYVKPAAFLWDAALQPVYDSKIFWWLYMRPES